VAAADKAVVSVATINGGSAPNIIADRVEMTGTIRALDEDVHKHVISRIEAICKGISEIHGATIEFTITHWLPVTSNDTEIANIARKAAEQIFGKDNVVQGIPLMGGEDFAFIAREIPSCYVLLGTRIDTKEEVPGIHNPKTMINEDALPLGTAFLSQTALDLLHHFSKF
jgi:amidohydrolase